MITAVSTPIQDIPICKLTLPLPPGLNGSYGIGTTSEGSSRIIATAALKRFKKDAVILLNNQFQLMSAFELEHINCMVIMVKKQHLPLAVDMHVYLKDAWLMDVDACIKAAQDALFKKLHIDDSHVFDLHVRKHQDISDPRCEMSVSLFQE